MDLYRIQRFHVIQQTVLVSSAVHSRFNKVRGQRAALGGHGDAIVHDLLIHGRILDGCLIVTVLCGFEFQSLCDTPSRCITRLPQHQVPRCDSPAFASASAPRAGMRRVERAWNNWHRASEHLGVQRPAVHHELEGLGGNGDGDGRDG
jgi:hypothetical protein